MPHCCAHNCSNQSSNNEKISFHALPSDEKLKKIWLQRIRRDKDNLPKEIYIFLCSNHFEEACFDKSHDMGMKYAPPTKKRISRQLLKGSIPTIFAYQTAVNPRKSSLQRSEKAEKNEVNFRTLNTQYEWEDLISMIDGLLRNHLKKFPFSQPRFQGFNV